MGKAFFLNLVKEKKLTFDYKIQSRVDLLLEVKILIEALASSGAKTVWVGAESGSQEKSLTQWTKGTTVQQIGEATQLLKSHYIKVGYFLQFGYAGETRSDIEDTMNMVLGFMPDEIGISVSYPLPGNKIL